MLIDVLAFCLMGLKAGSLFCSLLLFVPQTVWMLFMMLRLFSCYLFFQCISVLYDCWFYLKKFSAKGGACWRIGLLAIVLVLRWLLLFR